MMFYTKIHMTQSLYVIFFIKQVDILENMIEINT